MSDVGAPPRPAEPLGVDGTKPPWRMAEQYFRSFKGIEIETKPHNDGYVMTLELRAAPGEASWRRRVFFDPAGRITHIV